MGAPATEHGTVLDVGMGGLAWTAVVPVKALESAKSRMAGAPGGSRALAMAFLADTLDALLGCPDLDTVLIATSDPEVARLAASRGIDVVDDTGHIGINAAVSWAAGHVDPAHGLAAIVSDLPRLTPDTVTAVLRHAGSYETSFVADLPGTGTTMWLTRRLDALPPAFGADSRAAHRAAGAVDLVAMTDDPALLPARWDADTVEQLVDDARAPLGPLTRQAMAGAEST